MTTEEKAKAYDKALTLMKDCIPDKDGYVCVRPCDIFQELKESEYEIIRKSLILYLENKKKAQEEAKYYQGVEGFERWIAWLEKQSRQEPKWGDDDEQYLLICKNALRKYQVSDKWDADIISKWLEDKLKQGEQKPKWSEEDEDNLNMAIYFMRSENTPYSPTDVEPVVEWLCGLKQRMDE